MRKRAEPAVARQVQRRVRHALLLLQIKVDGTPLTADNRDVGREVTKAVFSDRDAVDARRDLANEVNGTATLSN